MVEVHTTYGYDIILPHLIEIVGNKKQDENQTVNIAICDCYTIYHGKSSRLVYCAEPFGGTQQLRWHFQIFVHALQLVHYYSHTTIVHSLTTTLSLSLPPTIASLSHSLRNVFPVPLLLGKGLESNAELCRVWLDNQSSFTQINIHYCIHRFIDISLITGSYLWGDITL